MTAYALLSLLSFVLALTIGIIVFLQSPGSKLHRMFLLLSLSIAGWALVEFGYRSSDMYETALFWTRIDIFWAMVLPLLLHMVLIFTERTRLVAKNYVQSLIYIPAIAFILIELLTNLITGPPVHQPWGWTFSVPEQKAFRFAATAWASSITLISLILLFRYYVSASKARRHGTIFLISGFFVTGGAALMTDGFLPLLGIAIPTLAVQSYLISGVFIGIAVWRYEQIRVRPHTLTESIIESMSDGLLVLSPQLEVVRVNSAACQLFKRSAGSLIGSCICDLFQAEPGSPLAIAISRNELVSGLVDVEGDAVLRRGGTCPVSISISTIPKNRGHICLVRDITERRHAHRELSRMKKSLEEVVAERTSELIQANELLLDEIHEHERTVDELIQSRTRFQELVDLLPEMVYEMDLNGMITYANRQVFIITGYSADDYTQGFEAMKIIAPEDIDRAKRNVARVLGGEQIGPNEYTAIRRDGSRFPIMNTSAPIVQNGRVVGVRGVLVDITNRKRIENELLNHERRFRDLLENVNMLAIMIDAEGTIEFVNDYFLEVTGWTREKLLGSDAVTTLLPELQRSRGKSCIENHNLPLHREQDILTASGGSRLVSWNNTLLFDSDGRMTGFSSIGEDITEKRSLEHQFLQAQKMETVGRLAGGVAHDFNNLLTIIIGNADIGLIAVGEESSAWEYLTEIKRTAGRATELIRQLLMFSRRQITEPQPVNINYVLLDMEKMLRRLIGDHIELVIQADDHIDLVRIDPGNLEQVITNLVVNARDAMPDGGTLTISTRNTLLDSRLVTRETDLAPGSYVSIRVIDTGDGIEPAIQDYLFEPFFTTKEPGKGTGLGLATSYSIITGLGGSIEVEHTSSRGTCMHVILPRHEGHEVASSQQVPETERIPAGSETLLVVEDEPSLNRMLATSLSAYGYRVLTATNGEEALEIGNKQDWKTIDLLLTDVMMPRMGGYELTQRARELHPGLPVLYISGYAEATGIIEDIEENRCELLQKPFTPAKLGARIRTILDNLSASPDPTEQDSFSTT